MSAFCDQSPPGAVSSRWSIWFHIGFGPAQREVNGVERERSGYGGGGGGGGAAGSRARTALELGRHRLPLEAHLDERVQRLRAVAAADGEVDRRLHEHLDLPRHVGRPRLRLALAAAGEQRAPRRAELEQEGEIEIERRH